MATRRMTIGEVCASIERHGFRCALVGGHAVAAWCEPRFTRDIDFAVAVGSDQEAERLARDLIQAGHTIVQALEHEPTGRLATVRFLLPGDASHQPGLDLLFASSGIEPEIVGAARRVAVEEGIEIPVAVLGHLLATKALSFDAARRPQDRLDLLALARAATPADLDVARAALALIRARGFDRGKDIEGVLKEIVDTVARDGGRGQV